MTRMTTMALALGVGLLGFSATAGAQDHSREGGHAPRHDSHARPAHIRGHDTHRGHDTYVDRHHGLFLERHGRSADLHYRTFYERHVERHDGHSRVHAPRHVEIHPVPSHHPAPRRNHRHGR